MREVTPSNLVGGNSRNSMETPMTDERIETLRKASDDLRRVPRQTACFNLTQSYLQRKAKSVAIPKAKGMAIPKAKGMA